MQITRNNWREHCKEPPLSEEEQEQWKELTAAAFANDDVLTYFIEATSEEWAALKEAEQIQTWDNWADLIAETDTHRRLQRAEIAAWRQLNERQEDEDV